MGREEKTCRHRKSAGAKESCRRTAGKSGICLLYTSMVEAPDHHTCEKYVDQVIEVMKKKGHVL